MKHLMQQIENGRFVSNKIVLHLLDIAASHGCDMNTIATMDFSDDDRMQFAQLIGYSVGGYGELSYVTDESYEEAETITTLRAELEIAKKDGERLDYLDSLNDKLNQNYKTNYGFKLHCSCNVIRIYSQSVNHIDLNDANSGMDKYTKVREAIDNVMKV